MLFFFFCVTQMTPSLLEMEPNSALFVLDSTCAYFKKLWGPVSHLFKKWIAHGPILKYPCLLKVEYKWLKASPPVLSMWLQTVKSIVKMSKCACLDQEIDFLAPNLCSLPCLVKGATQLCTSKKECNKLDLTAALSIASLQSNWNNLIGQSL
jgi:hypothetical protein